MFFKLPAITFPAFVQDLVILIAGFPVRPVHIFVTIFQANIFGEKLSFQTKYFRWNTDFSKVLFSAAQGLFKRNIFGHAGTFHSFSFIQTARFYTSEYFQFAIGISIESYIRCADLILQRCKVSRLRKYRINRNFG